MGYNESRNQEYLGEAFVSVLWLPGVIQLSEQPRKLQLQNLGVHGDGAEVDAEGYLLLWRGATRPSFSA